MAEMLQVYESTIPISVKPLSFGRNLPHWQVALVMVGFPTLYLVNSLTPWMFGMFVQGDRVWYAAFWWSILVLHWSTLAVTLAMFFRAGGRLPDIGLKLTLTNGLMCLAGLAAWAALLLWARTLWPAAREPPTGWQIVYPFTQAERWLVLCGACTAGICEEIIYRGFAIRALQGRSWLTWQAVLLAGTSFALIHGVTGILLLPVFIAVAIAFSMFYLWRGNLLPVIVLHIAWDMMMVVAW